ncbi:MAG TPA: hypothetical protein VF017_22420 [Thermoanaerobaculia bacterium]|nr:hypothetical protein [Thermoanaerobaculia bacterium]
MTTALAVAAFLAFAVGLAHSVLGERYILIRLFRRSNLPQLFGSTQFTTRTLRFAWHLTTVAWWGFGVILWQMAAGAATSQNVAMAMAGTFGVTAAITAGASKGRHLAWPVFLAIAVISYLAGRG